MLKRIKRRWLPLFLSTFCVAAVPLSIRPCNRTVDGVALVTPAACVTSADVPIAMDL